MVKTQQKFIPLELMMARAERFGGDSDATRFNELLYVGEFIVKVTTAAFVAAIQDDRENHRYRLAHGLVRASSVGDWARLLDEALTGPASQHLAEPAKADRKVLSERVTRGAWQFEAVNELSEVLRSIFPQTLPPTEKVALRAWFSTFATVRNKTRGHGAMTPATYHRLLPSLEKSVNLMCINNPVFQRPWAYLHRNMSGKYNVRSLGSEDECFDYLKSGAAVNGENHSEGLYIFYGRCCKVELIRTDLDTSDFYLPNGAFNGQTFELHSLISDRRLEGDATPFMSPSGEKPLSETHGGSELRYVGNSISNIPPVTSDYIARKALESSIVEALLNDRHPIVTLVGRGGIGKTSLALNVLHRIASQGSYDLILWFSARDIDLTMSGPKSVQPQVLTEKDIADDFRTKLKALSEPYDEKMPSTALMATHMRDVKVGRKLFVFDNFETVRSPTDLFQWLDTNIRLPNKIMITSRFRDFKADFPIEVPGMQQDEAVALIRTTAEKLGVMSALSAKNIEDIIDQSGGHPYVIKILLGDITNGSLMSKPKDIIARRDDILEALFERTFANLSPVATRIFLILSRWRSLVPQLALEAALLQHRVDAGDPAAGINELVRMSLVETTTAPDTSDFLSVPLTAALFGWKKLSISPHLLMIQQDVKFLQDLGFTTSASVVEGLRPRIKAFFQRTEKRISEGDITIEQVRSVLEFLARGYLPGWLMLAELQERQVPGDLDRAADYIRRFLEQHPPVDQARSAWRRLLELYTKSNNVLGACGAFLKANESSRAPLNEISNMANLLNNQRDLIEGMDVFEREAIFTPMARLFESHIDEATATDLSRLAWLYLHAGNEIKARIFAELGLAREPTNAFCQRLSERLVGLH